MFLGTSYKACSTSQHTYGQLLDDQSEIEEGHRVMNYNYIIQRKQKRELRFQCLFVRDCLLFQLYSQMKKTSFTYRSDVFDKSHLILDRRRLRCSQQNSQALFVHSILGWPQQAGVGDGRHSEQVARFSPVQLQFVSDQPGIDMTHTCFYTRQR